MLNLFRPSSEVVKEGRILKKLDTYKTNEGVFLVDDNWAHSKSRSYNLKNCNFFLVPVWRQDLKNNDVFWQKR